VETGEDYADSLEKVKFTSLAWTHDNKVFFSGFPIRIRLRSAHLESLDLDPDPHFYLSPKIVFKLFLLEKTSPGSGFA
jgi:hypothetical protein